MHKENSLVDQYQHNILKVVQGLTEVSDKLHMLARLDCLKNNADFRNNVIVLRNSLSSINGFFQSKLMSEIKAQIVNIDAAESSFESSYELIEGIINNHEDVTDQEISEIQEGTKFSMEHIIQSVNGLDVVCDIMESHNWEDIERAVSALTSIISAQEAIDDEKVADLMASIEELKGEVGGLSAQIAGLSVGAGAEIGVGAALVISLGGVGALISLFFTPAIIAELATITLDSVKITALNAEINEKSKQLSDVQGQAVALKHAESTIIELRDITSGLLLQFCNIRDAWGELHKCIIDIKNNMENIINNGNEWNIVGYVTSAKEGIDTAKTNINAMALPRIYFSYGNYGIGQSSVEIRSKYNNSNKIDIFDYINISLSSIQT